MGTQTGDRLLPKRSFTCPVNIPFEDEVVDFCEAPSARFLRGASPSADHDNVDAVSDRNNELSPIGSDVI